MKHILVLLLTGLVSTAPQFNDNNNNRGVCSCNGYLNSKGQGECRSEYQGKPFCYVDPGRCPDQVASSTEGRWWSHKACQERRSSPSSEFSPADDSKVNFGDEVEEKKEETERRCSCNGLKNSRGEGECGSSYKGQAFCYVDRGSCSDETESTSSNLWWSYQACNTQEKFSPNQASTTNVVGNAINGIIDTKKKLIQGAASAIGGIINSVFTPGGSSSEKQEEDCWCESDQAPFKVGQDTIIERRGEKSNIRNRIVNRPMCEDGKIMVCKRQEEEEEEDTAPLLQPEDPVCSCNGQLNNERFGVEACESSFRGAAWCYVQPGRCRDEMTSDTTGKTWSQDACGGNVGENVETNGVHPIAPRLRLELE